MTLRERLNELGIDAGAVVAVTVSCDSLDVEKGRLVMVCYGGMDQERPVRRFVQGGNVDAVTDYDSIPADLYRLLAEEEDKVLADLRKAVQGRPVLVAAARRYYRPLLRDKFSVAETMLDIHCLANIALGPQGLPVETRDLTDTPRSALILPKKAMGSLADLWEWLAGQPLQGRPGETLPETKWRLLRDIYLRIAA